MKQTEPKRFFAKILAGLALLGLLALTACEQPPGTGFRAQETLNDAETLAKIGTDPEYPLNGNYTLGGNLILDEWRPIGTVDEPFAGTFDGNGKTIALAVSLAGARNNGSPQNHSGGLFGFADGAVIRNLTVTGTITVTAVDGDDLDDAIDEMPLYAGGVVGFAKNNTTISNCASTVAIAVEGRASNSSAGGIAGYLSKGCVIADCHATGDIRLRCQGERLMFHAGGIAGYQGLTGSFEGGDGGCIIERCYFTGKVSVEGAFPYGGGIAGYNYAGSIIRQSYAAGGAVAVKGGNLPYAGGIAGYNSRGALIENCHSDMAVRAEAAAKQALAGGIAGANAADARVSQCYARGAVAAIVDGSGLANAGGSLGVPAAASSGGIAGAQYFNAPSIKNCVALNSKIAGGDSGSGAAHNVHRVAGPGTDGNPIWEGNSANAPLYAAGSNVAPRPECSGYDGADCAAQPAQGAYENLGWDFKSVWKMDGGYPVLR